MRFIISRSAYGSALRACPKESTLVSLSGKPPPIDASQARLFFVELRNGFSFYIKQ
jgi:hypothetical protein